MRIDKGDLKSVASGKQATTVHQAQAWPVDLYNHFPFMANFSTSLTELIIKINSDTINQLICVFIYILLLCIILEYKHHKNSKYIYKYVKMEEVFIKCTTSCHIQVSIQFPEAQNNTKLKKLKNQRLTKVRQGNQIISIQNLSQHIFYIIKKTANQRQLFVFLQFTQQPNRAHRNFD